MSASINWSVSSQSRASSMSADRRSRVRRPQHLVARSSSSSLNGMEKPIPSFPAFIQSVPAPNQQKELPPIPSQELPTERIPELVRRSSSIYSRSSSDGTPYKRGLDADSDMQAGIGYLLP